MKKYFLPVTLLVLGLAFLLASFPTKDVGAQGRSDDARAQGRPDDPGHQAAVRADGKVVAPDGVVFESQKEFVDAGRRCSTRHADALELDDIEKEIKANRGNAGRGNGNGGSDTGAARVYPNGSITIPVHFHVVYRSDGTGNIPEAWLDNQIAAMTSITPAWTPPPIERLRQT